jgi:hypothetical protein
MTVCASCGDEMDGSEYYDDICDGCAALEDLLDEEDVDE